MKLRLAYIFLLLISVAAYGQVNLALETDKKEYSGNENINVTIVLEINGTSYSQDTPVHLPDFSKFNWVVNGSSSNTILDPATNTSIYQMVYQVVLQPKQSGKFKIGSALVTVNGKIYKTEPFDITVTDKGLERSSAKIPSNDVYLNMELRNSEVYKNEPVVAVLTAYSRDFNNLRRLGSVSLPKQSNVQVQPVSFSKSDIEMNHRNQMSSQVVAVFMLFPKESGNIEIKPTTATVKEDARHLEKVFSNRVNLKVKSLPAGAPDHFNNAVGSFIVDLKTKNTDTQTLINHPVDVVVKLKGEGNLSADLLPKLASSDAYKIYPPKIERSLQNGDKGITGTVEAHYIIVPLKPGNITVDTSAFSFFDPQTKKYVDLGIRKVMLDVMTPEQIEAAKTTMDKVNEYTSTVIDNVSVPMLKTNALEVKPDSPRGLRTLFVNYVLIAVFAVFLLFSFGLYRRWQRRGALAGAQKIETVSEAELRLRKNFHIDLDTQMEYLDRLVEENKYQEYLDELENLLNELELETRKKKGISLITAIEKKSGSQAAENFRNLLQKARIEKYAPVQAHENYLEFQSILKSVLAQVA